MSNKKQKLFSCISGFSENLTLTSAKDDFYYDELVNKGASYKQRIDHLYDYAELYIKGGLSHADCADVDEALRAEMTINTDQDRRVIYFSLI